MYDESDSFLVQALLTSLNKAEDPDIDNCYIPNKDLPFHYNPDDDEVQQMEAEDEVEGDEKDEEFTKLLHMELENKELKGKLNAKVVHKISEISDILSEIHNRTLLNLSHG